MLAMFRLSVPSPADLDALLEGVRDAQLTYPEVGATRDADLPDGYVHDRYRVDLPEGSFDRAVDSLRRWEAHRGAGVDVHPSGTPIRPGGDVIVMARLGPLHALAPCRVV